MFESGCVVSVVEVNSESNEAVNVLINNASGIDWYVYNQISFNSKRDVIFKSFLGRDVGLSFFGEKCERIPIVVLENCVNQVAYCLRYGTEF